MVVARRTPVRSAAKQPANKKPPTPRRATPTKRRLRWFPALLVVFLLYVLAKCPDDTSPVCAPPVRALLHHADPYIAPAADLARTHVVPRATALVQNYNTHVAPRLHWFFVDQYWNGIIKPIYYKGVHPHLEHHSRPYRIYYRRFIVPGVRAAIARVAPHAQRALVATRTNARAAYDTARPHVIDMYRRLRPHVLALLENAKRHVLVLASKAGAARRQYVDPHVLRIWEKVSEPEPRKSSAQAVVSQPTTVSTPESTMEPTTSEVTTPESTAVHEPTMPESTAAQEINTSERTTPEPTAEQEPATPEPTAPESATLDPTTLEAATPEPTTAAEPTPSLEVAANANAISAPSAPVPVHPTPVPAAEHEAESAASVVAASLHAEPSHDSASAPASIPSSEPDADAQFPPDIAEFLNDIGFSPSSSAASHFSSSTPTPTPSPLSPAAASSPPPTPAERLALTAQKRAEITARHAKWQAELDALVRTQTHSARAVLAVSRGEAVARLAQWGVVSELEAEAGRLVKGVEAYLRGVEEKVGSKPTAQLEREREREMWRRVLERVESRMAEKVRDVHREVHEWYVGVREREVQEMAAVAEKVKVLADRAQADLGLDYAWLDDVTYYDWQKYHDLMRTSENFTAHAHKIQAQLEPQGTNALVDALNVLEREVGGVVDGFARVVEEVRARVEGRGGVFAREAEGGEEAEEGQGGEGEGERVSILPVPKPVPAAQDVFVGRDKEEVEARLEGVRVEREREEL
ncbi:hypothetical protein C0992_002506 [Termitomyces sp. T32_za158]|nr:hypothetical protein C0992_002506 [Termitomyces sp. T32_za158]